MEALIASVSRKKWRQMGWQLTIFSPMAGKKVSHGQLARGRDGARPAARIGPIVIELKGGETYYWCRCGRSANQALCDGSHKGTGLQPMVFRPSTHEGSDVRLQADKKASVLRRLAFGHLAWSLLVPRLGRRERRFAEVLLVSGDPILRDLPLRLLDRDATSADLGMEEVL